MSLDIPSPITRLHVQVTAAERGEDNFRIADQPGAIAKRAPLRGIQDRMRASRPQEMSCFGLYFIVQF